MMSAFRSSTRSTALKSIAPAAVSSSPSVMYSGIIAARGATQDSGVAIVTRPAPDRTAPTDDRDGQPVHVGDDRLEQPRHRSVEARADDRVDNQVALGDLAEVQLPLLCGRDLHHRQTDAAEDLEVDAGIAPHVADAAEQKDGGLDAALRERPRDDEAVAA